MANNINGGAPNAIVAKSTISFASAGITSLNTEIIYLVDDPLKSYVPGRAINGITGFVENKGYYMVAKLDMDMESIVAPPLTTTPQLSAPGSFAAAPASDTQINLSWSAVTDATGYVVDRATNVGFTTGVALGIYSSTGTSYNDTGRTASTQYFYRIRATAAGFTDSSYSTANATTSAGSSYDTDAQAYFDALVGASVTPSTPYKDAVNTMVLALKSAGVWTKVHALYLFRLNSAAGHKFNLKNPANTDGAFRLTFTGGVTHSATGITGDSSTSIVNTHYDLSIEGTNNNTSLGAYLDSNTGNGADLGADGGGGSYHHMEYSIGTAYAIDNSFTAGTYVDQAMANAAGFMVQSRTSSTSLKLYKNGTQAGSTATTTNDRTLSAFSGFPVYLTGKNDSGTAGYSPRKMSLAFIGAGLTDTEVNNFSSAVTTLLAAI